MIAIGWCSTSSQADRLASFFAANVTPEFISHAELQTGRALSTTEWSPGLKDILKREIEQRLSETESLKKVAAVHQDNDLVGIAYVSFNFDVPVPFAILEDVVVRGDKRGSGIGRTFLNWILERAKEAGARRVFLESGKENHAAHHFFEQGDVFRPISVVMMAELSD